ncbi:MAG: acyl-ACP--UDP-N-acetylglucosamine O-acyltransferase [Chitinivibrionales bacterium]|nr:acyl-ACP--UDP-N-acetylglucosamine O-acyltransferase [Chitinivibrionales bacterium]MBD3396282.1 acyl-ACP--UDP-N-acetylglucosamine O-acyltransferase [Chitinivibrionales bacterium]
MRASVATTIHPTAIVDSKATLGENVSVGPYAIVEDNVEIGDGSSIGPHALVAHGTRMGRTCRVFHGASVGTIPQDLKFAGEETTLEIGENTIIREFCTLNRGTSAAGKTVVGKNCALLSYCHVAHDCMLGDNVIASNNLGLAGHVTVGNHVTFGGFVIYHQFGRIGDYVMVQSGCRLSKDIVPFALCGGNADEPRIVGINKIGLERRGFDDERRGRIKRAFKILFREGLRQDEALASLEQTFPRDADIAHLIDFVRNSQRGIVKMDV